METIQNKIFENEFMRLEMKDDIMYGTYKKGPITLELAKQVVKHRLQFTGNKKVPILASEQGLKGIERDARQYLSSEEGVEGLSAAAIVNKSVFGSHLANFFMKIAFNRPRIPARVFTDETEAIQWLKQYIVTE